MPRRTIAILALFASACAGGSDAERDEPDGADGVVDTTAVVPAPNDTGPWMVDSSEAQDAPNPHAWMNGRATGGADRGSAMLTAIRSARHDGYDRIVLEFDTHVPPYAIEYVDKPQYECGSGEAAFVEGDGWLQVAFTGANNHTEEGRPTTARRIDEPAGANLLELRRICDFEAHVTWIAGVGSPNEFRAFPLEQPARLVVDIRH